MPSTSTWASAGISSARVGGVGRANPAALLAISRLALTPRAPAATMTARMPTVPDAHQGSPSGPARRVPRYDIGPRTCGGSAHGAQQEQQRRDRDRCSEHGRDRVGDGVLRPGQHDDRGEDAESRQHGGCRAGPTGSEGPVQRREHQIHHDHRGEQDQLVLGAEQADRQVLHPGRDDVDEPAADGHERRRGGAEGEGDQLRDGQQHDPADHAGEHRPPGDLGPCSAGAAGGGLLAVGVCVHHNSWIAITSVGSSEPPAGSMLRPIWAVGDISSRAITIWSGSEIKPASFAVPSTIQS